MESKHEETLLRRIRKLNRIGILLSQEHSLERLLALIVEVTRDFYRCEAGSLFTRDGSELIFRVAQNDVLQRDQTTTQFMSFRVPISKKSIAGYCADTAEIVNIEDAYDIPSELSYSFDPTFDKQNNYRTRSILAVPLLNHREAVVGVLQLINPRKRDGNAATFAFDESDFDMVRSLASQASIALTNAELVEAMRQANIDTIMRLSVAAEYKDVDTASHIERMSRYSASIARELGFDDRHVELIKLSSPMHDVGKIGIPDAILLKPGKLTNPEFEVMKRHTEIGARILSGSDSKLLKMAELIAWTHHEKWNGSGYPRGISGDKIPIEGRIVAVADVFDALCSRRCYKPPFSLEKSLGIINEGAGSHFDPDVVKAFHACLDEIIATKLAFEDSEEDIGDAPQFIASV